MRSCGDKPELVAIGVAPLGIISIGVVPMGVVSIGVVPMGVVSLGVVGMGVLVAGVHAMGIWTLSPQPGHHHTAAPRAAAQALAYRSQAEALKHARALGCTGVHRMGSLWMPCASHP
jgi:hypothetical protein